MKRGFVSVLLGLIFLFFQSCSNFMSGSNCHEVLNSQIEYEKAPSVSILVAPASGTGVSSPDENVSVKKSDKISLRFDVNSQYAFDCWKCVDKKTGEEVSDAVSFENSREIDTTASILSAREGLWIIPYCVERPKIVSVSPLYDSEGVARNTEIRIQFNQEMNENSIYYTEIPKGSDSLEATKNTDKTDVKYYGYIKDGVTYFKNITISNLANENLSFNQYYDEPYFKTKKILVIPVKADNLPPAGADILVQISNEMQNTEGLLLADSKEWPYLVNKLPE